MHKRQKQLFYYHLQGIADMDLSFFFIFTINMIKTEAVLDETLFGQQTEPVSKCLPEQSNVDQLLVNLMKSQEKVRTLMHYTATFR